MRSDAPRLHPAEIRKRAGLTLTACAVFSKTAVGTLKLYVVDRDSVSNEKRDQLDAYFCQLEATLPAELEAEDVRPMPGAAARRVG